MSSPNNWLLAVDAEKLKEPLTPATQAEQKERPVYEPNSSLSLSQNYDELVFRVAAAKDRVSQATSVRDSLKERKKAAEQLAKLAVGDSLQDRSDRQKATAILEGLATPRMIPAAEEAVEVAQAALKRLEAQHAYFIKVYFAQMKAEDKREALRQSLK